MNLCRLCGEEKSPLDLNVELNDRTSSSWSYRDLIEHHTRVSLKSSKLLPQSICEECRSLVDGFSEFSSKVQSTQNKFEDDEPIPEIKECFVQIEQIDEGLLERSSSSRGRRKRAINYNEQEDSPTKRGRFEAITFKVEPPEESSSNVKMELEEFISKVKEEMNVQEAPTGRLRHRKKPVPIEKKQTSLYNKTQPLYGDEIDTLEKLFDDEFNGKSKFPLLHLDVPESCKLPSGEVPEEFAEKISTLRWKDLFCCLVCGEETRFENVLDLKKHQLEVHKKNAQVFGCHICEGGAVTNTKTGTPYESTLMNHHLERHYIEHLKFCCMVCSKMFYDLKSLHQHYKTHEGGFHSLICFICGFTSRDLNAAKYHKAQHFLKEKGEAQLLCEKIQDKFDRGIIENPTNPLVEDHERNPDGTVSDECQRRLTVDWSFGTYHCSPCNVSSLSPFDIYVHMNNHHSPKMRQEPIKNTFKCKICEKNEVIVSKKSFDRFFTFVNHAIEDQHAASIEFSCVICMKMFWNLRAVVSHYKEVHRSFTCIVCNHCGKVFEGSQTAAFHYNNSIAEENEKVKKNQVKSKDVVCDICGWKTLNKYLLKNHLEAAHKIILPENMVTCEICGWKTTKVKLKGHLKSHSDLRPYNCEICGGTFKTKPSLRRHQRAIHDKIYDKKCSYCDRKYYSIDLLKIHERRHKGEKPFKCTENDCTAAYVIHSKLKIHMRKVHGIDARSEAHKLRCAVRQKLLEESEKNELGEK